MQSPPAAPPSGSGLQPVYESGARGPLALALDDLISGARDWNSWATLGWLDIKLRYRGSVLGPFWITLSMGITIGALGLVYGTLFKIDLQEYFPFLTLGFLAWMLISTLLFEGCLTFVGAQRFIKAVPLPFSVHVYRLVWRNLIVFAHNLVVYVVVAIIFRIVPNATTLLIIPGLALVALNGVWVCLLLGMACARFLDIQPIVASLVQLAFFVTPVIWKPGLLVGRRAMIVDINPFYHFVELIRGPLAGYAPSPLNWMYGMGISVVGWAITILLFRRFRSRIAFWV